MITLIKRLARRFRAFVFDLLFFVVVYSFVRDMQRNAYALQEVTDYFQALTHALTHATGRTARGEQEGEGNGNDTA